MLKTICQATCLVSALLVTSCAAPSTTAGKSSELPHPDYVQLTTPGTKIVALDGSWSVEPSEIEPLPFPAGSFLISTTDFASDRSAVDAALSERTIETYLAEGAKPVWVYPQAGPPLYGVLALGVVTEDATSAVSRVYHLAVSQEHAQEATGGRIAAVWEEYDWQSDGRSGVNASWMLWMSDVPLPGFPTGATPPGP